MERRQTPQEDHSVPGTGGAPASSRDGQQGLRLHAGIAVVAFILCAGVTAIFFWLGSPVLGVVFAVLALGCLGVLGWARRRARGAGADRS